ncbi:FHA domain-containing protein [Rugamonas rubra]|uniref:Type III secretion protein D n=1 Tax=Rugamonas rubra TaxID=758825 RepID=A0A1I4M454_9BURK|nr:FHA domain-containing protein [Rugamonas rubra]SFL97959.1 type III secretion protein D [Rugamonas rubra]
MFELRVLNGLHRGAALPLDEQTLLIGAGDDADVVLVDPGVAPRHASLSASGDGWLLAALDGLLYPADSARPHSALDLAAGDCARLGPIWLAVMAQDAAWIAPPAQPSDGPWFDGADDAADGPAGEGGAARPPAQGGPDEAATAPAAACADAAAPAGAARPGPAGGAGRRRVLLALLAAMLSCAAAYAITGKPEGSLASKQAAARARLDGPAAAGKPADKTVAAAFDAPHADAAAARPLTADELRAAFRKRLSDADLLKRFDLDLQERQWLMQAALDDEEADRFARILTAFVKQHHIGFHVSAKIGSGESMLPFKIKQVVSGANASVITQDGERVYVGDEYRGVRLVAIQANQLSFAGKRKIEVKW